MNVERQRVHFPHGPGIAFVRYHHGPGHYRRRYLRRRAAQLAANGQSPQDAPPLKREDLQGTWAMEREAELTGPRAEERKEQTKAYGLDAAESIKDRSLTLFRRNRWGAQESTFIGVPFLEDMRQLGGQDVVFVGAPLDTGTTFRPGTRFGPMALRLASRLGGSYNPGHGLELHESLTMVDAGDIQVIPANI